MKTITPKELNALIGKANIIDVRETGEYVSGHVPSARNIPMSILPTKLSEFNKDETYYIICQSGGRSSAMANFLAQNGFDVVDAGGTMQYSMSFPLEK